MEEKKKSNRRMKDMTEGNPIKLILWFAIPLFIGNIFQQFYNIVDTMIAGYNLGSEALAAIGSTSSIYSLIIGFASGMNSGYGIIVSKAFGAKDREYLKKAIAAMMQLNLVMTVILTTVSLMFITKLMKLLNTPENIFQEAHTYIVIILGGMLMTILYNMCAGLLRALGNSRTPLYFLIISCVINLSMDSFFIMGLHTGVGGAAAATVIAQTSSVILCGIYIFKNYREILPEKRHFHLEKKMVGEMFYTGLSMGMMSSVYSIGSVILQGAINGLGTAVITAHTAARRIIDMMMQPLSTIASANSTFVGQNWGGKKFARIKNTMKKVMMLEILWSTIAIILVFSFGEIAVKALIGKGIQGLIGMEDKKVIDYALMSLHISLPLYYPLGILLALRTSMQAMGCKIAPVVSSGIELGIKVTAAWILVPLYGYLGASVAEPISWVACMLFLSSIYLVKRKKLYPEKN